MKRKVCLLLAILFVFVGISVACVDNTETPDVKESSKVTDVVPRDDRLNPDLEILDLDGYCFSVFGSGVNEGGDWNVHDLLSEENLTSGDVIDESIYRRNTFLEDTYNFSFALNEATARFCFDEAYAYLMGGEDIFDAYALNGHTGSLLSAEGLFLDLKEQPYLDLSKDYWAPTLIAPLTINGRLFTAIGDISVVYKEGVQAFYFNKTIATDKQLPDIYELVRNKQWTYEKLFELAEMGTEDLNGDQKFDANDCYGIQGQNFLAMVLFQGSGESVIAKDSDDKFVIGCGSNRAVNVIQKITDLLHDNSQDIYKTSWQEMLVRFENQKALFYTECMLHIKTMRGFEVDFGIIPTPMYDEDQTGYHHYVNAGEMYLYSLPYSATDPERSAYVLETTAVASKHYLTPAFYEISLKSKWTRDEESKEMLDIIFSTVRVDPGNIYGVGSLYDFVFSCMIDNGNIVRVLDALSGRTTLAIDETLEKYENNYNDVMG